MIDFAWHSAEIAQGVTEFHVRSGFKPIAKILMWPAGLRELKRQLLELQEPKKASADRIWCAGVELRENIYMAPGFVAYLDRFNNVIGVVRLTPPAPLGGKQEGE